MRNRSGWWGITHILILLLVVTLAPFIVLEIYRGAEDVQRRRETLTVQTRNQAVETSLVTDDFLGFTQRFLASMAGARSIQALDPGGSEVLLRAVRLQNPNYETVFLYDANGLPRAGAETEYAGLLEAQWPHIREALTAGQMTVGDVVALPGTDRSVLLLAYPVSAEDGTRVGVIGVALNVARLSSVIGYPRLPRGSVVLVAQRDGTIIAASSDAGIWFGQTLAGLDPFRGGRMIGRSGATNGALPDGGERLIAYQPVGAAPWLILSAIPQAEVSAALRQSLLRIAEEAALALVATMLLAWIMLRRLLVPIQMLSDGARAFAAGSLDHRVPLRRRDELGALADALNGMASALGARLEEEAAHAAALTTFNRLQTEFVATASHELRTPVTAIRTYAEALLRPDIGDEEIRRECLDGIDHSSQRLAQLARTLLDVSRIDSGQIRVNLSAVDAVAAAAAAGVQASPQAGDTVSLRAPSDLPVVAADPERLEDVLANLLGNAVKFSPAGTPVAVDLSLVDGEVVISVKDGGVGLAADDLPRIFDRFYQVQGGSGRTVGGSGLGLYIARAYVLAMGGRIWVESTPGRGSIFLVALRLAEARNGGTDDIAAVAVAGG